MLGPFLFSTVRGLDGRFAFSVHPLDAVADPINVLLDRDQHIAEHGWARRPSNREQVRESVNRNTQVTSRAIIPRIGQLHTTAATNINA